MGYKEMKIYQLFDQFINKYMNNEFFFTKTEVLRKLGTILPKNMIEFLIIFSLIIFAIFNLNNLEEKFYSGKTRALYGTHLSVGDKMFSSFPYLRSLATITWDTLDWYDYDEDGGSVHDVIGTRCDPYTSKLLTDNDYHYCCHSNLTRALVKEKNVQLDYAEKIVHDVLNVFMLTGFTNDTKQYFMKASPVRPGDYLEFFAETDLLGALSACPGGDCGSEHSSDVAKCYPLKVSIWTVDPKYLNDIKPSAISNYNRNHGIG